MLQRFAERIAITVAVAAGVLNAGAALAREPRHAAMVIDANTGAILHNDDGDEQRHPASLTKMMTLYLTFETIEQGRMSMSTPVPISEAATNVAPSKLDLDAGDEITAGDAIRALITKSANDVAVALAEKIGGSQANFVRLMNAKAKALGMSKTNFENASGLPDSRQVTTARDMITLGLRLQDDFPQHYRLFATREFTYHRHSFRNHNTLMNTFAGIDGIKTGYTQASGFNLVSSVHRNGRHLVAAVFGGRSAATRNGEMRNLLTRTLTRASTIKSRKPAPALIAKLKAEPKLAERPAKKAKSEVEVAAAAPVASPRLRAEASPEARAEDRRSQRAEDCRCRGAFTGQDRIIPAAGDRNASCRRNSACRRCARRRRNDREFGGYDRGSCPRRNLVSRGGARGRRGCCPCPAADADRRCQGSPRHRRPAPGSEASGRQAVRDDRYVERRRAIPRPPRLGDDRAQDIRSRVRAGARTRRRAQLRQGFDAGCKRRRPGGSADPVRSQPTAKPRDASGRGSCRRGSPRCSGGPGGEEHQKRVQLSWRKSRRRVPFLLRPSLPKPSRWRPRR